jgi:hypothetical protein
LTTRRWRRLREHFGSSSARNLHSMHSAHFWL